MAKEVGAVVAATRILRFLAAHRRSVGVTEVARSLELNPSTCFNILRTLTTEGLVAFDAATKAYSPGLGLAELAASALDGVGAMRLVRPHLEALADRFGVTMTLWLRTGPDRVVLIDRAEGSQMVRIHMTIGQRLPLLIGTLGRCMAAHSGLPEEELARRYAQLRSDALPPFATFPRQVAQARRQGYAVDADNFVSGITTVSAAVRDGAGRPVMALSAVDLSARLDRAATRRLGEALAATAEEIGRAFGSRPAMLPAA
ncbi:IclR family transcriptional regulator [Sabulicella rubraurantiaca]|uniref:IclR family transcriptional regulator n=1 Tax=Sabulicella rubraurantiaca TaxID=2811429 RepID=UPI001A9714B3|nr:IclR family transcriptional regulator [Sabulicella rubraurantiaca]